MAEPKGKYAPVPQGQTRPPIEPEDIDRIFPPSEATPFDPNPSAILPTSAGAETALAITGDDGKNAEGLVFAGIELLDALAEAELGPAMGTTYREFNTPGESLRAIFNGMTTISKMGKEGLQTLDAVCFQTATNVFLNSGANLVDQCRQLKPGTPIQITFVGEVSTKAGNDFKKFDVNLLRMRPAAKQTDVTAFWTRALVLKMSKEDAHKILDENGGDFAKAREAIEPTEVQAGPQQ